MEQQACVMDGGNSVLNRSNSFPLSVFSNGVLSSLENIVVYLKECRNHSFREISVILNRDERTIWCEYKSARQKFTGKILAESEAIHVPLSAINSRELSVLESITEYLKEELGLRYCKIAMILKRDARTIWTVYTRAKRKRKIISNEASAS